MTAYGFLTTGLRILQYARNPEEVVMRADAWEQLCSEHADLRRCLNAAYRRQRIVMVFRDVGRALLRGLVTVGAARSGSSHLTRKE